MKDTLLEILNTSHNSLLELHLYVKSTRGAIDETCRMIQILNLLYVYCHLNLVVGDVRKLNAIFLQKPRDHMDSWNITFIRSILEEVMVDIILCEELHKNSLSIKELLTSALHILSESFGGNIFYMQVITFSTVNVLFVIALTFWAFVFTSFMVRMMQDVRLI
jgi:hypothetical protein